MPATIDRPAARGAALLIVDMLNDLDFAGGACLVEGALPAARRIARLRDACDAAGVPTVWANDNFGQWHSERSKLVEHVRASAGACLVEALAPREEDYFVIKPRHSAFYATNLPVLLPKLEANRIILAGLAADICVLFTAAAAHMRDYGLWCPRDCVAAERAERRDWALEIMGSAMRAETAGTDELPLEAWLARG